MAVKHRPVTWWLSTSVGDTWGSTLWFRKVPMEHLPAVGDTLHILWNEAEGESEVETVVKSRYWDHDGSVNLTLMPYVIDPDEYTEQNSRWTYNRPWRTADEQQDLPERLESSGWKRYGT